MKKYGILIGLMVGSCTVNGATAGGLVVEQQFLTTFLPSVMQEFSEAGGNATKSVILQTALKKLSTASQSDVTMALATVFQKAIVIATLKEGSLQQAQDALGTALLALQNLLTNNTLSEVKALFDQQNFFTVMQQFMENQRA